MNLDIQTEKGLGDAGCVKPDTPPRIYILYASVAGDSAERAQHFSRIASLGFDWVCWIAGADREPPDISALASEAQRAGLKLMLQTPPVATAAFATWAKAGVAGFLVSSAAERSAAGWQETIAGVRGRKRQAIFVADTLGRPWEEVLTLASAGFDYLINSAAWWDLREGWFLQQHQELSRLVPTLATPEPLDGMRLAHRLSFASPDERHAIYRGRYLLAAMASSGIICPMGYEFASPVVFDGPAARVSDWDFVRAQAPFDLSEEIAATNRLKRKVPVLSGEGALRLGSAPGTSPVALVRTSENAPGAAACLLINGSGEDRAPPPLAELAIAAGATRFLDPWTKKPAALGVLTPYESRLLFTAPQSEGKPLSAKESKKRLEALAANRVVIERVSPEIDGGRFPVKRVAGESLRVEADIFCDGHEVIDAALAYRAPNAEDWSEAPMALVDNDRWAGSFPLTEIGRWTYTVVAWRDLFATWRQDVAKKHDAGQAISLELIEGRELVARYAKAAKGEVADVLKAVLRKLETIEDEGVLLGALESAETAALMRRASVRSNLSRYDHDLEVTADRPIAACAAWYEMMPRSQSGNPLRHGTFDDVIARLPYVRDLGFDVLYFPPIHPIGKTNRKGPQQQSDGAARRSGQPLRNRRRGRRPRRNPSGARRLRRLRASGRGGARTWARGRARLRHPVLARPSLDQGASRMVRLAAGRHDQVRREPAEEIRGHRQRPLLPRRAAVACGSRCATWCCSGSSKGVQHLPRRQSAHQAAAVLGVDDRRGPGASIPRRDFLAEAFTRPKMMKRLAKIGFTQSYTYFTWRNTKSELTDYLTELTKTEAAQYMRPNFFVNTPDIKPVFLQTSGRPASRCALVLAATLEPGSTASTTASSCARRRRSRARRNTSNSEKYEIQAWDWDRPGNIKRRCRAWSTGIRRSNPALQALRQLTFLNAWNDNILCYAKIERRTRDNLVIVAVNLDPHHAQGADFEVPLWEFGLPDDASIEVVDLLSGKRFTWHGKVQHVCARSRTTGLTRSGAWCRPGAA